MLPTHLRQNAIVNLGPEDQSLGPPSVRALFPGKIYVLDHIQLVLLLLIF